MHVVVIVYQDASFWGVRCWEGGGGGYHLSLEKNYLMTSGRLSIRSSISR